MTGYLLVSSSKLPKGTGVEDAQPLPSGSLQPEERDRHSYQVVREKETMGRDAVGAPGRADCLFVGAKESFTGGGS